MTHIRRFIHQLATLFRAGRAEADLEREIGAHLQLLEDEFTGAGMTAEEARSAARRAFGGVEQAKERQRDARSFRWLAGWAMDLRLGVRMLVKSPGLTVIAVLALAVAFGAGATYLQFVNGLVRPSLAFPGGHRLVGIVARDVEKNAPDARVVHDFRRWRDELTLFENIGASQEIAGDLITDDGRAEPVDAVRISASAFTLVPARPLLGRPLVAADEDASAPSVAVIGETLWQSRFDRDPAVVGRVVTIGGGRHTIVGVMPGTFGFPVNQNLWVPFRDTGTPVGRGEGPAISVFGRLRPGVGLAAAQGEVAAVTARAALDDSRTSPRLRAEVNWYVPSLVSAFDFKRQIVALYAANLAFVALLALCAANVATLVFGRTIVREAEITVRAALGASRGRIVSQLVTEALVLSSIGAGAGLVAASVALRWVRRAWETGQGSAMPFWWNERLGGETYLYTALLAIVAALIVGAIPALKATGPEMQGRLKDGAAGSTMRFGKLWTGIIVTQVAVTVVFLLTIVSLAWSIVTIDREYKNVAFERGEYVTAAVAPNTDTGLQDPAVTYRQRQELLRRVLQAPTVESATYTTRLPGADQETTAIEIEAATAASVRVAHVGPGFFETFDRKMVTGRQFSAREIEAGADVGIVDEAFVHDVLGGRSAVGVRVREAPRRENDAPGPWIEIVGVTEGMSTSARKTIRDARFYRPIGALPPGPVTLVVHARPEYRAEGLGAVAAAVREAANAVPGPHVSNARAMNAGGEGDVIQYVFAALGIVGAIALLLSTAGVYALVSFTLARRTREIGIRTALGASPRQIVAGSLSRVFLQIGVGVAAGVLPGVAIVGSVAAESGRNGLADGVTVATAVAAFVLAIAAAACLAPLRRALRIEPTDALRVI